MLTDQRQVRKDSVILPPLLREASQLQPGRTDHSFSVPRILSPAHDARLLWQHHALQIFPFNGWRLVLPSTMDIFHKVTDEMPNLFVQVGTTWLF